jgi:hypothetical protein
VLARLTEFDATFAPREARATALEAAADLGPEAGLAALAALHDRGELLDLADGRQTTRAHRALERATVARARDVARTRVPAIEERIVAGQVHALAGGLAERGAVLAPEQERAVELACGDRQLVVIVGQAGTGKSTALLGVARAHEQAGRRIVVASTGAQAAERLAGELRDGGVDGRGYSTTALRVNVEQGRLALDRDVTVLHDEAALASTREQAWLLGAVGESGARLVMIGDPRQSRAVGAGGLWPVLERTARGEGGFVELSRIVRAQDPADRRDQAVFRSGQHERALAGYAERGLVVFAGEQRRAEDGALEAAQADRAVGRRTLVVAECSNEQLDGLNARAQAIRIQEGELGPASIPLAGRPYALHGGDMFMVRSGVHHPSLGAVRNGTGGDVLSVDAGLGQVTVRLTDGREGTFDRSLLDAAATRLAYVSHPFLAQGQTTDTTHVIATRLSTAEGSYVGLTRARSRTHVYAATDELDLQPADAREKQLAALAERLGRSVPEMPSIRVPLAHEQRVEREHAERAAPDSRPASIGELRAERDRLQDVVRAYPMSAAEEVSLLERSAADFARHAAGADAAAGGLRAEVEAMGRLARRGSRANELRTLLTLSERRAENARLAELAARTKLAETTTDPASPARWESEHPQAREQLADAERALAQAVSTEAGRAVDQPGEHLIRVLGQPPDPQRKADRETWTRAAQAVETYRITHEIDPAERSALGPQPEPRGTSWERRADWRRAGESVLEARKRLGIDTQGHGPVEQRLARVDGLIPDADRECAVDRGHGWEL